MLDAITNLPLKDPELFRQANLHQRPMGPGR